MSASVRKLGWGVVGTGRIVEGTMAPAMVAEPECELVAAVSRDQGRADAFAAKFGAPFAYTDYEAMLANPEVQAVYIATPNAQHAAQVVAAARAGKHVLCDKPMAVTVADAIAEVEACARAGVRLGINFHNRHLPWVRDVKRIVEQGLIGDVINVQVEASAGGRPPVDWRTDPELAGLGTVYNVGVHVFDFLRFILDSEIVDVAAMFDDDHGRYRVDTQAFILMRFSNGVVAYVNCNQTTPYPQNDIAIYGTKGRIAGVSLTRSRIDGVLRVLTADGETETPYPSPGAHRLCLAAYTKAVLDGEQPNASGEDGLRSMQLCEAMARSVRERCVAAVRY